MKAEGNGLHISFDSFAVTVAAHKPPAVYHYTGTGHTERGTFITSKSVVRQQPLLTGAPSGRLGSFQESTPSTCSAHPMQIWRRCSLVLTLAPKLRKRSCEASRDSSLWHLLVAELAMLSRTRPTLLTGLDRTAIELMAITAVRWVSNCSQSGEAK